MKKNTEEWIKSKLIEYLDTNNLTVIQGNYSYRLGIGSKKSHFKNHYKQDIEDYIKTKFHLQCEEEETEKFYKFLMNFSDTNEQIILDFFKNKSPANKTKIEKDGEVKFLYTSSEHQGYQKKIIELIKDEDMLFNYMGNLRFLAGEKEIVFNLIENFFSQEKKETLVEMYLNCSLMKNVDFEIQIFHFLGKIGLNEKYSSYFPNLKTEERNFSLNEFENKQSNIFMVNFTKKELVQQLETEKSISKIFSNISNIVNLQKIPELNIDVIHQVIKKENIDLLIIGDELNLPYIKIAITEYMRIVLKEEQETTRINDFVSASSDFQDEESPLNTVYKNAFEDFKDRIQKIQLKEKLELKLNKEKITKNTVLKI